jgi:hypothetical protein
VIIHHNLIQYAHKITKPSTASSALNNIKQLSTRTLIAMSSSTVSSGSWSNISSDSINHQKGTIAKAKEELARATALVEEGRIIMEQKYAILNAVGQEGANINGDFKLASKTANEARNEWTKRKAYREWLLKKYLALAETELKAAKERESIRLGYDRIPSAALFASDKPVEKYPQETFPFSPRGDFSSSLLSRPMLGNRRRVGKFYERYHVKCDPFGLARVQCMVTSEWSCTGQVVAGRIIPVYTPEKTLKMLGLSRRDLDSPRNMLLLSWKIKKNFDLLKLTFILHEDGLNKDFGLHYRLKVYDNEIKGKKIFRGSKKTIGDYDGKIFRFHSDDRIPFVRALSFHAQKAYERAVARRLFKVDQVPRPVEYGSPLKCEAITCDFSDDQSTESDRSVATEEIWEPLDFEVDQE